MEQQTHIPVDVPVAVACQEPLRSELTGWLEADVGWQVVSEHGALRPVARLTDDERDAAGAVLVRPGPPTAPSQRRAGAAAVVAWPAERDRLVAAVLEAAASVRDRSPRPGARRGQVLSVGGTGGGVGTSTVVWALAALAAWRGASALVVGGDDLLCLAGLPPWSGPDVGDLGALDPADIAAETAALAVAVAGVPRLSALGWPAARRPGASAARGELAVLAAVAGWPFDVVLADFGTAAEQVDVVVAEPDARAVAAGLPAARLVLRMTGPLSRSEATRIVGGRPRGWIDEDPRVRRAGADGRVPTALPGRWLRHTGAAVAGRPRRRPRRGRA